MPHSTITRKGQTTIPGIVRQALRVRAGDRLDYQIMDDHVILRVHPGAGSLGGALSSEKGSGLTFEQIREAAAQAHLRKHS